MSSPTPNTLPAIDVSLNGPFYAFNAAGGFEMEAGFTTITQLPDASFNNYDVTNALQVVMDVAVFNEKLNLFKDYATGAIITSSYSPTTQEFDVSSITISASDFKTALPHYGRIISVGAYTNMYTNFENYVKQYFGYPGGFASLFNQATLFDLSSNDFDNIHKLLVPASFSETGETATGDEISGNYIKDLSGNITISNITKLLRHAVDANIFGNRASGTSADPSGNPLNFGVGDGFMAGDLIYVPTGTKLTLDLDISPELYSSPFNNPNENNSSTFSGIDSTTTSADATITNMVISGDYSSVSTITRTNVKRVLTAALLIRLVNSADLPAPP
jgi:hypothetical protein